MTSYNFNIQSRITYTITNLIIGTSCCKYCKSMYQRCCATCRKSRSYIYHISFRNSNIKKSLRILLGKIKSHRTLLQICVKHKQLFICTKFCQCFTVCYSCRNIFSHFYPSNSAILASNCA